MRRRLARPFGHTVPPARMLSLLMGLAVLALLYQRVKEPQMWRWMTNEGRAQNIAEVSDESPSKNNQNDSAKTVPQENIVLGPNETDPDELAKLRSNLKAIQDRQPLQDYEMSAYWQLLGWSRTRPFAELEKLARRDVPYSHLWEEPDLYRGQPIRLKLHVRRVLTYDAPENPLDVKKVFEVWGWTDNSRSFPFVGVLVEKPTGLPIGTDVDADLIFVGYFVKWMGYRAFDAKKNAPLLVGRAKPAPQIVGPGKNGWESAFLILVGGVLLISFLGWFSLRAWRRPRLAGAAISTAPDQLPDNWLSGSLANERSESNSEFAPIAVEPAAGSVELPQQSSN